MYAHQTVDALNRSKQSWLNPAAYLTRVVFFFAVWIAIAGFYFFHSRHQDLVGGDSDTRLMEWWSGVSVFAFGMTLTYVVRGASLAEGYANSWGYLLVFLLLGHFVIPFLGIMSRHVKSNQRAMICWTAWLLVMHYLDLYWLVMPELGPHFTIGLPDLNTLLLVACTYLLGASIIATRTSLVPTADPRLSASLGITDAY